MSYDYQAIEKKWHDKYQANDFFKIYLDRLKTQSYLAYTPSVSISEVISLDVIARFLRMKGNNVLFPMLNPSFKELALSYGISFSSGKCPVSFENKLIELLYNNELLVHSGSSWYLNISSYYDLIEKNANETFSATLDKVMKKEVGVSIKISLAEYDIDIPVYVNRPELIFGATFLIVDKDYSNLLDFVNDSERDEVIEYINTQHRYDELVFTGSFAINPFSEEEIPVFVGSDIDYGSLLVVPAHDEFGFVMAKKYDLDIKPVIAVDVSNNPYLDEGTLINSGFLDGYLSDSCKDDMIDFIEKNKIGKKEAHYGLSLLPIAYDDESGKEITLNEVIYRLRFEKALKSLDAISFFGTFENSLKFDSYARNDMKQYLPANIYSFTTIDEYIVSLIGYNLLFKEQIADSEELSKTFKLSHSKDLPDDDFYDLNRLCLIDEKMPRFEFLNMIEEIWRLKDKDLSYQGNSSYEYFIYEITGFLDKGEIVKALKSLARLVTAIKDTPISLEFAKNIIKVAHPFVPFVTEELNEIIGDKSVILSDASWPFVD